MARETLVVALGAAISARVAMRDLDRDAVAERGDGEAYWEAIGNVVSTCDELAAALAGLTNDGFALRAFTPDGRMLMLNRSAQRPGRWQLTRFDRQREPWGDTQYDRKRHAIREMLEECDLRTLADMDGPIAVSECHEALA